MRPHTLLFHTAHRLWRNRLTVLAYHRIADPYLPGLNTFKPNISATTEGFATQMDMVAKDFDVISTADLITWLQGEGRLPSKPLLITFDDGYQDNYTHAWPVLKSRGLPAVIYITTGFIDTRNTFYWDKAAYAFACTSQTEAVLPIIGHVTWHSTRQRDGVLRAWLEAVKKLPESDKSALAKQLPAALGVDLPEYSWGELALSWDQIREMAAAGIEIGGHTHTHPILTRITPEQAWEEIAMSKARVDEETRQPALTFAYTNGGPEDFTPEIQNLVRKAGYQAAFTLIPGPERLSDVRREPMAIRRIFISHRDTPERFRIKLVGAPLIDRGIRARLRGKQ